MGALRAPLVRVVLHLLTMNIYDKERILSDRLDQILRTIRAEQPNVSGAILAHYSETLRFLNAVRDEITSLEEAVDTHLPR